MVSNSGQKNYILSKGPLSFLNKYMNSKRIAKNTILKPEIKRLKEENSHSSTECTCPGCELQSKILD